MKPTSSFTSSSQPTQPTTVSQRAKNIFLEDSISIRNKVSIVTTSFNSKSLDFEVHETLQRKRREQKVTSIQMTSHVRTANTNIVRKLLPTNVVVDGRAAPLEDTYTRNKDLYKKLVSKLQSSMQCIPTASSQRTAVRKRIDFEDSLLYTASKRFRNSRAFYESRVEFISKNTGRVFFFRCFLDRDLGLDFATQNTIRQKRADDDVETDEEQIDEAFRVGLNDLLDGIARNRQSSSSNSSQEVYDDEYDDQQQNDPIKRRLSFTASASASQDDQRKSTPELLSRENNSNREAPPVVSQTD
eukprot:TRINITY_DN2967_c0_g1_i4.p1 TRINITY_DN2967_c0_g1~~TRINITY_DN2967_c0_g1_i4.p1  ORF type:complete len:300 (+),score=48.50 TRINITY_DN2967_c0_g1_i4:171-1070(+)